MGVDDTAEREQGVRHPRGQRGTGTRIIRIHGLAGEQLRFIEKDLARDRAGPFADLGIDDPTEPVQ